MTAIFEQGLPKTAANHVPLSPLTFIERSASIYPDYPAVVHGSTRRTWSETCPISPPCLKHTLACRWPAACLIR